jgi:hypothetical protein
LKHRGNGLAFQGVRKNISIGPGMMLHEVGLAYHLEAVHYDP